MDALFVGFSRIAFLGSAGYLARIVWCQRKNSFFLLHSLVKINSKESRSQGVAPKGAKVKNSFPPSLLSQNKFQGVKESRSCTQGCQRKKILSSFTP